MSLVFLQQAPKSSMGMISSPVKTKTVFIIAVAFLLITTTIKAQHKNLKFEHIGTDIGSHKAM
ncbi:hypothetical protein [Chryseosolibacter indicus]|uniref:Uncharacterized protein n=1 Tax=Chryseosolibacter indicus TaxID=2782351 RepID=A0ABS5VM28_9BACT|nr:hypothetical protein [Chryseosolibacter indicus]MBT1701885.1 hypothetical protein [Chryseosolibacter indicus]